MQKITEQVSNHRNLEKKSTTELLKGINTEDQSVALKIADKIDDIGKLVDAVYQTLSKGGRLFYIGAGTSGRLGIVDASECPPTFGVPAELVTGLIAGGDQAIRTAVEFAEDNQQLAWDDLRKAGATSKDIIIGLAASGTTPYVLGGLKKANENGLLTGCIVCNPGSPIAQEAQYPIEIVVGPEFVTGSTRMKAGTAQKLVLNMITTSVMIKLGRVIDNRMVDMALSNDKLWARGSKMLQEKHGISDEKARQLLKMHGSVRLASKMLNKS